MPDNHLKLYLKFFFIFIRHTFEEARMFNTILTLQLGTYRSSRIFVVDLEVAHGFDDCHNGLDCVAVDNCSVLLTLIF